MYNISNGARQRFRLKLQNIQFADEIIDALDEFLNRFILISNEFQSDNWNTVYTYTPVNDSATMITFSIIAKELESGKYAGFKKTAMFYKQSSVVNSLTVQQSDFTDTQDKGFAVRLLPENGSIKMQVKGFSNNLTKWKGSIQVEQHSGE
jgi:hypothetical protein